MNTVLYVASSLHLFIGWVLVCGISEFISEVPSWLGRLAVLTSKIVSHLSHFRAFDY